MFPEVVESPSPHGEKGPRLGGCGLLSTMRSRVGRWADTWRTIYCRHPALADMMVRSLSEPTGFRHFDTAASCREELRDHGNDAPAWRALLTAQPQALVSQGCWPFPKKVGSGAPFAAPQSSSSSVFPFCVGRCVGEKGFCIGVCSSSLVSRSGGKNNRRMCSCGIWIW